MLKVRDEWTNWDVGFAPSTFTMTFPRKIFSKGIDFGQSLKEAGMTPSCALIVG